MDTTRIRFMAIAIGLLLIGGFITLSNRSDKSSAALPTPGTSISPSASPFAGRPQIRCPPGPRAAIPKWFPKDLSLPAGAYALNIPLPKVTTYNRAALAVPSSLRDFVKHIATRWPEQGWTFTHAEVEFVDAEAQVTKSGRSVAAALIARAVCGGKYVQMYLTYGSI
ncbi:MAG: hypothetical protein WAT66_08125 [Actinomycetota bacterium]